MGLRNFWIVALRTLANTSRIQLLHRTPVSDQGKQNEQICLCGYLHWTSRSVDVLGRELDDRFIQFELFRQLLAEDRLE